MGIYTFRWPHAAEEVYVTGTFDDWSKSIQLDKVGDGFEKTVPLPDVTEKILYKYVVDGRWVINITSAQEKDHEGNENNVLRPEDVVKQGPTTTMATINTVGPESSTAQLAGQVPLEENKNDPSPPGGYPETPANDLNKQFFVNPLPAAPGAVNPIELAPGQPVPREITGQSITSHVTLDKASYEQSGGIGIPGQDMQLPPVSSKMIPESSLPMTGGTDVFNNTLATAPAGPVNPDLGVAASESANDMFINTVAPGSTTLGLAAQAPLEKGAVPSDDASTPTTSMPGAFAINTVAPESSTIALAGQAPLEEPAVPGVVKESQEKAKIEPGSTEVQEKATVEEELLSKVHEAPSTSEGVAGIGTQKSENDKSVAETVGSALATTGTVALAMAIAATEAAAYTASGASARVKDATAAATETAAGASARIKDAAAAATETATQTAADTSARVKDAVSTVVQDSVGTKEPELQTVSPDVPVTVQDSIAEAHTSPEAASNTIAVQDKKEVESELLKEVQPVKPHATKEEQPEVVSPDVPATVKDSIAEAHSSPEAASNTTAVHDKTDFEAELLREVKEVEPIATENKPISPDVPATVKDSITEAHKSPGAAADTAAVHDKKDVETELLEQVKPVEPIEAATPTPVKMVKTDEVEPAESKSDPTQKTAATVPSIDTNSSNFAETPAKAPTPPEMTPSGSQASASSPVTADKKKKNRVSMLFSKIKTKVTPKDKS